MIDPNKIVTEGKFDEDFHEDPVMIMVDLFNEELQQSEDELMLGPADEMVLVDIVAGSDSDFDELDNIDNRTMDEINNSITPRSQR